MEPIRILLVDDDVDQRTVLVDMLAVEGYESTACSRALEALALLEDGEQFGLLLSDVVMPELDGFEFVERVHRLRPIPVVFLTGKESAVDRIVANGHVALLKPFNSTTLRAVVEECLGRSGPSPSQATPPVS